MNRPLRATLYTMTLTIGVSTQAVAAANLERGEALYENHCRECHESNVHIRNKSKVRSLSQLRMQVTRWSAETNQQWKREDIEDVMGYLNARYYQYPPR